MLPRVIWLDFGSTAAWWLAPTYFGFFREIPVRLLPSLFLEDDERVWEKVRARWGGGERDFCTVNSVATFRVCVRYDQTLGADFFSPSWPFKVVWGALLGHWLLVAGRSNILVGFFFFLQQLRPRRKKKNKNKTTRTQLAPGEGRLPRRRRFIYLFFCFFFVFSHDSFRALRFENSFVYLLAVGFAGQVRGLCDFLLLGK